MIQTYKMLNQNIPLLFSKINYYKTCFENYKLKLKDIGKLLKIILSQNTLRKN